VKEILKSETYEQLESSEMTTYLLYNGFASYIIKWA